ncbi:hypothetical protein RB595_004854, partial [Gaeumannomyces hyphopodioides]
MPKRGPENPLGEYSPHKRTKIATEYELGTSRKLLAEKYDVPYKSIHGIASRYQHQESATSRQRSGRPRALSDDDVQTVIAQIRRCPFILPAELLRTCSLTRSFRTLKRALLVYRFKRRPALRRPRLTESSARSRLEFARRFVDQPLRAWKKWIFSDESTIVRGDGDRTKHVWCKNNERLQPKHVQPKEKPTRHGQMFWGAFGWHIRSTLYSMHGDPLSKKGGVSSRTVLECLQENLPTICSPGTVFMQDNASTHQAAKVQEWLQAWAALHGVELVSWPANSPDLNPIENLWSIVKAAIHKRHPELAQLPKSEKSRNLLIRAAVEAWEEIKEEVLEQLVISMQQRLQAVIDANGWYT